MAGYWQRITDRRLSRRRILRSGGALSLGIATAALVGCSSNGSTSNSSGTSAAGSPSTGSTPGSSSEKPKAGGTAGFFLPQTTENFNTPGNWAEGTWLSGINVYDRPISNRVDGRVYVLEAAEKVEQPEATRVVITLRSGLVYQDKDPANGRAVKASDIVAMQNFTRDLTSAANNTFQKSLMDKVEAPDDLTVVFTLKSPNAYVFSSSNLSNPPSQSIIPQEILDNIDTTPPVGSGPYQLDNFTMDSEYVYKRFDKYRDADKGLPYVDERHWYVLSDPVAQEAALRSGQVDFWFNVPSGTIDRLTSELGDKVKQDSWPSLADWAWGLQMLDKTKDQPWLKDQRVREAFYRATNRQQYLDLVFQGKGVIPPGPLAAGFTEYQLDASDTAEFVKFDIAQAKQLLDAAQFPYDHEFEIMVSADNATSNQGAQVMQRQLKDANIKTRVATYPFDEWLPKKLQVGNFDVTVTGFPAFDTPAHTLRLHHSKPGVAAAGSGLKDPDVDALIEKSEQATDHDQNVQLVKQVQLELLKKYSGLYNLLTPTVFQLMNSRVRDFEINPAYAPMYWTNMWLADA